MTVNGYHLENLLLKGLNSGELVALFKFRITM